jgi:hypothetical protein
MPAAAAATGSQAGGVLIHRPVRQRIGIVPGRGAEQPALAILGDASASR